MGRQVGRQVGRWAGCWGQTGRQDGRKHPCSVVTKVPKTNKKDEKELFILTKT